MKPDKILGYTGIVLGMLSSAFFLVFLIGEGLVDLIDGKTGVIPIMVLILFTVGGYILSFFKRRTGAIIMIGGAIAMSLYLLFSGGISEYKMALIFAFQFLIPGILLYYTPVGFLTKRTQKNRDEISGSS